MAKTAKKKAAKKKSSGGFLDRLKKSVVGDSQDGMGGFVDDDSIDLDSGVIQIDDAPPEITVSTAEILRESTESESSEVRGSEGKVFVIDLGPFFKAMGTKPGGKLGKNLIMFAENLLARAIGRSGTYTLHGQTQFLFRLTVDEVEGWKMASKIVNELGVNFLRDGFNPEEMLPEVLAMVDEEDAFDADGQLVVEKALAARIPYEPEEIKEKDESGPEWYYEEGIDPDADKVPEWDVADDGHRSASDRVERGPPRRTKQLSVDPKKNRRKIKYGRRDSDNPNASVW
tara:strand:+ start:8022 stop:8879 length:858 start_codon:yes stop_codon:yes gene_type:complete